MYKTEDKIQGIKAIKLEGIGRKYTKSRENGRTDGYGREEFWALKQVNLKVLKGQIVGIIGKNGSGKTTLLEVIGGIIPYTTGKMEVSGKVSSLLALGTGFQEELSGRENIFLNGSLLGLSRKEIKSRFTDIVNFSELQDFIDEPLGEYSDGMKMRLGFSIAVNVDFDILLVDEVILVGDISFQKKCFEKLLELKNNNKTMIVSTQAMDFIERLCDRVVLLEGGKIQFTGEPVEGILRYRKLLNKKSFLKRKERTNLISHTKKWATDMDDWGEREGTGEIEIVSVKILNSWNKESREFKKNERVSVRTYFNSYKKVKNCHFGVALFREDGIYCYGPNTKEDGYGFGQIDKGEGMVELTYDSLRLQPGIFYFAVAIWDEKEAIAYDYHKCSYKIKIKGNNHNNMLFNLKHKWNPKNLNNVFKGLYSADKVEIKKLRNNWEKNIAAQGCKVTSFDLLNRKNLSKRNFFTGEYVKLKISSQISQSYFLGKIVFWVGIFRNDEVYCQGFVKRIFNLKDTFFLVFPELQLLPGQYRISFGFWDIEKKYFITYSHGIEKFFMVFSRSDHGTLFLNHRWDSHLPQERQND